MMMENNETKTERHAFQLENKNQWVVYGTSKLIKIMLELKDWFEARASKYFLAQIGTLVQYDTLYF